MRHTLLTLAAAAAILTGAGVASAQTQTTTTTTWSSDQGTVIEKDSTTRSYKSFDDPSVHVAVGQPLPTGVTVYDLPGTIHIDHPELYSYTIVNHHPVVVERETHRVVHSWDE